MRNNKILLLSHKLLVYLFTVKIQKKKINIIKKFKINITVKLNLKSIIISNINSLLLNLSPSIL